MSIIILIPGFLAAYIAWTQSPNWAFLNVYIPVLLFLPDYYSWSVPAFPDPNFPMATILPIVGVWVIRNIPGWRFSFTDLLVFGYALSLIYSESLSPPGRPHFQNFTAGVLTSVVSPYILAKCLIEPAGLREAFAKRIAIVLFIVGGLLVFQSVTQAPYTLTQRLLGRFFPGQGWMSAGDIRMGLRRATGPYSHEILAGIIMWVGFRIQRWLEWSQAWPSRLRLLPWLPIPTARLLSLGIMAGAIATLVRGPMIGAVAAAIVLLMGRSKKRWIIFWFLVLSFFLVGIPVINKFINYASVDPSTVESRNQETVVYRWQLVINYIDIAKEEIVWGWGRFGWPKVKGQKSIDNHLLLLFLQHGIMGVGFFIAIFLSMMIRLFIHSMLQPIAEPLGSSLGFTLLGLYIVIFISLATVFQGYQTVPLFFLIVGWSEGYLRSGQESLGNRPTTSPRSRQPFKFMRVLK